ncbi:MAG: hypothetical protein Q8J60_09305 [Thiobacillus sp.]|nr:hypothetical protein [Thiobacillus sp.]
MGRIHSGNGWIIKVQANKHPPIHAHVLHPNGKATVTLAGEVANAGGPRTVVARWSSPPAPGSVAHAEIVEAEWQRMNNPRRR